MKRHEVSFDIQSRIRGYLKYTIKNEINSTIEDQIMPKLNKSLKKELLMASIGKFVYSIPVFKRNFSERTIEKIVFAIKKVKLSPDEALYKVLI